ATARRSQKGEELATGNVQIDAFQCCELGGEDLRQALQLDGGRVGSALGLVMRGAAEHITRNRVITHIDIRGSSHESPPLYYVVRACLTAGPAFGKNWWPVSATAFACVRRRGSCGASAGHTNRTVPLGRQWLRPSIGHSGRQTPCHARSSPGRSKCCRPGARSAGRDRK